MDNYALVSTKGFEKDLEKLDRSIASSVLDKLQPLAENPGLAQLLRYAPKDLIGIRKYRIGDWRVLCWRDDRKKEIILYRVCHRKEIYKRI